MELRSGKQVHFIRAIKGKSVEIVPNIDGREGRPLTISKLEDIYKKETVQCYDDSLPKVQQRALTSLSHAKKTVKSEPEVYEVDLVGEIGRCSDDISSGNMTLKQIRKQCKATKRKRQGLTERPNVISDITVEQEDTTPLESEDDSHDLEETLGNVKSRLLKRRKGNVHSKSGTSPSRRKNLRNKGSLPITVDVKLEVCEIDNTDCETMARVSANSFVACNKWPSSSGVELVEVPVNEEMVSAREDAPCFAIDEESHEIRDKVDPKTTSDVPVLGVECSTTTSSLVDDLLDSEFLVAESWDDGYHCNLVCNNTSQENDANVTHALSYDTPEEDLSTQDYDIEYAVTTSSTKDASWLAGNRNLVQKFDIDHIDHGLLCLEMNSMEISCEAEDPTKDELSSNHEVIPPNRLGKCSSAEDCSSSSGIDNCLPSVDEDCSPMAFQSVSPQLVDAKRDHKSISFHEAFGLFSSDAESDGNDQPNLHRPPERLLSGRKVISPSAQEKLRTAMDNPDLPEKKTSECKGKLYFSGQNAHRFLKAEGLDRIKRVEIAPNSKHINRKTKQVFHQEGSPKVPRDNHKTPRFSTGRASVQCCSQKAIDFSQRQMRDAEFITTKLSNELKAMRILMQEYLQPEASPSTSPKPNADQVEAAIKKSVKTEEAGIKLLAAMERDSNRFCKLMRLAQDGSAIVTPDKTVCRKTKKITFADEAGGDLCHVKVYKNELESPPIFGQEKLPTG